MLPVLFLCHTKISQLLFSRIVCQLLFRFDKCSLITQMCTAWVTGGMEIFFLLEQNGCIFDMDMIIVRGCLQVLLSFSPSTLCLVTVRRQIIWKLLPQLSLKRNVARDVLSL